MPYDGANFKPSLTMLSDVLRHPENWPPGFEWDYGDCKSCAMGLAFQLWHCIPDPSKTVYFLETPEKRVFRIVTAWRLAEEMAIVFNMPLDVSEAIFCELGPMHGDITPIHVADAIDAFLVKAAELVA